VSNDDYRLSHVSGSLGYQTSNGPDFLVTGNIGRDERGFPGPYGSNPIGAYTAVDRVSRGIDDTRQIGGRFAHPWSPRVRERIEADYTDLAGSFTSPFGPSNSGTRRFDGRVQEDVALSSSFGGSAGIEFQRESGSSSFITGAAADPIPIHRAILGAFGELRYVWSERLFVTGGLRLEHITRHALEGNPDGFLPRPPFPDQTVDSVNPKVAVSYLLTGPGSRTSTRLRASAGTGIRPPDAFEIAFTNNPNLLPERSRSIDAGIEQQFAGGAVAFAITGFYNRYDDLIVAVGKLLQDASIYQTDNIANARSRGFELSGSARALRQLTVHANYTYLDTENLSVDGSSELAPPPFKVGDPLIRRPRHQGVVDLTYAIGRVTAFGEVLARSQILDVEPTFGAFGGLFWSPGYSVINAGASVRVTPWLDVYARVLNLADRAYEETLGYPALRRTGMVGVRVAAGR
jgi:outer membrane receptor protein involved in Fe transport